MIKKKRNPQLDLIQSRIKDLVNAPLPDTISFGSSSQATPTKASSPEVQAIATKMASLSTPESQPSASLATPNTPSSGGINPISLIQKYFPKEEWANAQKVMQAESGGDPNQVGDNFPINGETIPSVGLFQIRTLPGRPSPEQLKNAEFNVAYAAQMQRDQGWQPWSTARSMGLPGTTPLPN